jgi:hypothetical protein
MTVTSGKQWRKRREEGVEIRFPTTKNIARIRPLDITFFLKEGRVHNLLESAAFEGLVEKDVTEYTEDEVTAFQVTLDFLNKVTTHCFVSPKIVDNPTADDEISIEDVLLDEKYFLFSLLARPAQALDHFRPKQADDVGRLHVTGENGQTGERNHASGEASERSDGDAGHLVGNSVRHSSN